MKQTIFILFAVFNFSYAQIGVNLSIPERGGTFIDVAKDNYRWVNASGNNLVSSQVDDQAWPTIDTDYIWDNRPVAEWIGEIDDPEEYRIDISGTYKCSFNGSATLTPLNDGVVENMVYDPVINKSTFDFVVEEGGSGLVVISFDDTKRTDTSAVNTGFTNFSMLRPGYENDDNLFHQPLLDILTEINFGAIRFMDFTGTNGSVPFFPETTKWENRKLPSDASQRSLKNIGKRGGACWEHVIDIANKTMRNIWINVQVSADSNYVVKLATMLKDNLDPSLKIYVESSNEVWNTAPGYEQTKYNINQATALGISEYNNHIRRTVELSQLFGQVYGESAINDKIRVVMSYHAPLLKWRVESMMNYVNNNFGPPSDYIYSIASQTYFTGSSAFETVDEILDNCHDNITSSVSELSGNEAGRVQWIDMAAKWNLKGGLSSYEGGPDHGGGSTSNIDNRITAERSERMCDLFKYNLDTSFLQLGGKLAMQFTLSSAYTRYGCWGLTDDINHPYRNYKMACVKEIIDNFTGINETESISDNNWNLYPNPTSNTISIDFEIRETSQVHISIQDVVGKHIKTILNDKYVPGIYQEDYNNLELNDGVYFVKLQIGEQDFGVKKIVVIR